MVNKYDLTGVGSSDNTDLKCVWVSTYDATHHWDYCVNHKTAGSFDGTVHGAGGIRGNKVAHVKTNNGVEGKCHAQAPYRIESCACGWSQNVAKPAHVPSGIWYWAGPHWAGENQQCKNCNVIIQSRACKSSAGVTIGCGISFTCVDCGNLCKRWHSPEVYIATNGEYRCGSCNLLFATGNLTLVSAKDYELKFRSTGTIKQVGATRRINSFSFYAHSYQNTGSMNISIVPSVNTATAWDYTATVVSDKANIETWNLYSFNYLDSGSDAVALGVTNHSFGYPGTNDVTAPTFVNYTTNPAITAGTWAVQRDITATFSDATTNYVDIGLQNSSGTFLVPYGRAVQSGNNFSRTFRLMIDAPAAGSQFILIAKDRSGNVKTQTINLSYTDAVAPSSPSVSGYNTTWTKSKTLRLTVAELGSGEVEIAFNKTADYCLATKSGTSYYRDFIFEGTVPTPVEQSFLVKDKLGNSLTHKFTVGYLDNTLPVLTVTQNPDTTGSTWYKGDISITVTASDEHSGLQTMIVPAGCSPTGNISLASVKSTTKTFIVREPGLYQFSVTDVAGNQITKTIDVVKVDNVNPDMTKAA